jgi:hypothetical protein
MFGGIIILSNSMSTIGSILYSMAAITLGAMLYLLLSTLLIYLFQLFIKVESKYYRIASLSITLIISLYGMRNASNLRITHIEIPIKRFAKHD